MPATILTPFREGSTQRTGRRTFRKQLLPVDRPIAYKGKTLSFNRPYLEQLAKNFQAGAYDQVPAVLANDDNQHNENPENFRGEVKSVELTDEGLDVVVEMTERGADLIAENPRLGVSARLVPEIVHGDGTKFENVLRHVCLTMDPRANNLHPWETVSVRSLSQDEGRASVIDLSASEYMDTPTLTDEHLEALKGLEGDARVAEARKLLGEMDTDVKPVVTDAADEDSPKFKDKLKNLLGIGNDEEENFNAAIDTLLEDDETTDDKKVVAASLSDTDRQAIDLANADAKTAREEAQAATARLAEAEWKLERKNLLGAGVPPAMLDLAEPLLKHGPKQVIDLSNGDKLDAGDVVRKLLASAKKRVDLSGPVGFDQGGEDADERDEARKVASDDKGWEASV